MAKEFKREARSHGSRLVFGRPCRPRGRGKIESYHKTLWRELISQVTFSSLAHFKSELRRSDREARPMEEERDSDGRLPPKPTTTEDTSTDMPDDGKKSCLRL